MKLTGLLASRSKKVITVQRLSVGKVTISFSALESLTEKVVSDFTGTGEVRAKIYKTKPGVGMKIRVRTGDKVSSPALADSLKPLVKERVFQLAGIKLFKCDLNFDSRTK